VRFTSAISVGALQGDLKVIAEQKIDMVVMANRGSEGTSISVRG
jgi:hypothetical protein